MSTEDTSALDRIASALEQIDETLVNRLRELSGSTAEVEISLKTIADWCKANWEWLDVRVDQK